MVKFTSDGNRKENCFHFDTRVGFRIYLRFVTVVGMAKAEQQSSEQGVQGRFSYGRFRAVVSVMHKNLRKKNSKYFMVTRGLQYIIAQKTN